MDRKRLVLEKLTKEIKEARIQVEKGKIYTQKQIMKDLGSLGTCLKE